MVKQQTSILNGETLKNTPTKFTNNIDFPPKVGSPKMTLLKVLTDLNRPQAKTAVWIPNRFDINPDVGSTPDATSHTSKSMDGWIRKETHLW